MSLAALAHHYAEQVSAEAMDILATAEAIADVARVRGLTHEDVAVLAAGSAALGIAPDFGGYALTNAIAITPDPVTLAGVLASLHEAADFDLRVRVRDATLRMAAAPDVFPAVLA